MRLWIPGAALAAVALAAVAVVAEPSPSDARLKRDIAPLTYGLQAVLGLEPVTFRWNPNAVAFAFEDVQIGLIAQQVARVIPELVREDTGFAYISYDQLTPVLINAIQEQQGIIVEQQEQIAALAERLSAIEQRTASLPVLAPVQETEPVTAPMRAFAPATVPVPVPVPVPVQAVTSAKKPDETAALVKVSAPKKAVTPAKAPAPKSP
jgi:hypothetical protein